MSLAKRTFFNITALCVTFACLVFIVSVGVAQAVEYSGDCGENATWVYDASTSTLTVEGSGETPNYNASGTGAAPWTVNGITPDIKNVVIGEGITSIGGRMFYGCSNATTFTFPSTLEKFGNQRVFSGCSSVEEFDFSNTQLSTASWFCFEDCISLKKVILSDSMTELTRGMLASTPALQEVVLPKNLESIADDVFWESGITEFTVPETVTKMDRYIFEECPNLTTVIINAKVTAFNTRGTDDDYTFQHCPKLKTVVLPETLEIIGAGAFTECTALETMTIPDSVKSIGASAFSGCTSLQSVSFGSSLESISTTAFRNCKAMKELIAPNALTTIGVRAFDGCSSLKTVILPESVNSLAGHAFDKIASSSYLLVKNPDLYAEINDYPGYYVTESRTRVLNKELAPALKVTLKGWTYGAAANKPSTSGVEAGAAVSYKYYSDAAMTKEITSLAKLAAGTYYVKASVPKTLVSQAASASAKFTVAKATPTVKVKANSYKVAYGKNYKSKKTTKKLTGKKKVAFTASSGGKATIAAAAKNGKVSIAKNGTITVKKGCKKGTYTLKVKVNVAAKGNYSKLSKKVVKVKVKVAK